MSKTHWPLCLNTSTIRPASLEDKIAIVAETGYTAVELWSDDLTRFEKQGGSLSEVRQRATDVGLGIPSVIALFDWMQTEGARKDSAFAEVRRRMEEAVSIGASYIVASPVPDAPNVDIGRAAAAYHELIEVGDEIGVTRTMEFLGFSQKCFPTRTSRGYRSAGRASQGLHRA